MNKITFTCGLRTWGMALCFGTTAALMACGGGGGGGGGGTAAPTPDQRAWQTPVLLETDDTGPTFEPQIAVNASGSAVAVWYQQVGTNTAVVMANHTSAGQWGAAQMIGQSNASLARVAIDDSGNALAVWQQSESINNRTSFSIWARRLSASTGQWGAPTLLENNTEPGSVDRPQIAMHHSGSAMAVWQQGDGITGQLHASHYNASTLAWGTTTPVSGSNTINDIVQAAQVAMDGGGNAVVVWSQTLVGGTMTGILSNHYSANTGLWSLPQRIDTNNAGDANVPQLATDASGNTTAVWLQYDGVVVNLWTNRRSASTGQWGTAALLELDNRGDARNPQVAMDAGGNAIVVWEQSDTTLTKVYARRYSASTGQWAAATPLETDTQGEAFEPQIAMHANGNATAVWGLNTDAAKFMLRSSYYNASTDQWGSATPIPTKPADALAAGIRIATDGAGNVWAVWVQAAGQMVNIWANVLKQVQPVPLPLPTPTLPNY
jgi:hypothetical protein